MKTSLRHVTGEYEITEQPKSTFFKDEGGKKNCLIAIIKVQNARADGIEFDADNMTSVPTIATICYESGEQVEQKHQYILRLVNENGTNVFNVPINGAEKRLLFRIEKVSRRFDSRKFVVRFSAHKRAGDTFDFSRLSEIKTSPIEVFSKRKVKSIIDGDSDVGKKRRRVVQTAKASDLDEVKAKYAKMFHDIRTVLERQQRQINDLVYMLESRNITRGSIITSGESNMGIAGAANVVRPPQLVGLERFADPGLAFNFGPPTPIDMPALQSPNRRRM